MDHIAEGIDLVFRVGSLQDSNIVAQKLFRYRHQLGSSPEYLEGVEIPRKPMDLSDYPLLAFSYWTNKHSWSFMNGSRKETIAYKPHLAMNDYSGIARALISGACIGELPPIVRPDLIKEEELVEVIPNWRFVPVDVSIVHLSIRHTSKPVRLFKEFTKQMTATLVESLPC